MPDAHPEPCPNGSAAGILGPSACRGTDLQDQNNKKIGDLEDVVLDRGTGEIAFLVVDTVRSAGRSGKTLLLSYRPVYALDKDADKARIDAADLATAPEFEKRAWHRSRWNLCNKSNRDHVTNAQPRDPNEKAEDLDRAAAEALARQAALEQTDFYQNRWPHDAKLTHIDGEIVGIERRPIESSGEYTYLVVKGTDGQQKTAAWA